MIRLITAMTLAALLAACTGGAQQTGIAVSQAGASVAQVVLSPADIAQMRATCRSAQPALAVATNPGLPATVTGTAVYPAAFCAQLLAGVVPATTDANTLSWLPSVLAKVQVAAQFAGVILPAILPLL